MRTTILFLSIFLSLHLFGQSNFVKNYTQPPWGANSMQIGSIVSTDSSYYLSGNCGDVNTTNGISELFLMKCSLDGTSEWTNTYGDLNTDIYDIQTDMKLTSDNNLIILGYQLAANNTGGEIFVMKVNLFGDTLWTKTIDGPLNDYGLHIEETSDSGFIITGHTYSFVNPGSLGVYLIKLDSMGNLEWTQTYGGDSNTAQGMCVKQTSDGGYAICGVGAGIGSSTFGSSGCGLLIKTDNLGNVEWSKSFGTIEGGFAEDMVITNDDGYLIFGNFSNGGPLPVGYLLKLNAAGDVIWLKGYSNMAARSIAESSDSTYLLNGESFSGGDNLLIEVNALGDTLFTKKYDAMAYLEVQVSNNSDILMVGNGAFVKTNNLGEVGCSINQNTNVIMSSPTFLYANDIVNQGAGGVLSNTQTKIDSFTPVTETLCFDVECEIDLDLGNDQTICSGDDLELDAGAGYNYYNWSTGETTQTITVNAAGTYTATVGDSTPVVNNHSMEFDGDDEVMVNNINLTNQSGITIQFWAKSAWNEIPTGTQNEEFLINFGQIGGIDSEYRYTIARSGDDLLYASCEGNGFGLGGQADQSLTDNSIINNEWVNIAAVYRSNGTIELYLNGNSASLGSFTPNNNIIGLIDGNNFIGSNDGNRYLIGSMDQVSYWNTPLSQSEIQNYMSCPPSGNESGLVGYWNFEEGSGNTAIDQTSNGNDGTINGATYSTDTPEQVCLGCTASADAVVIEAVPTSSTDTQEACESFTWIDGNTYTDDNNTATFVTTNAAGCDSTITLDLTILESSSSSDEHEECEEYTWIDGNTYTESNNTATFVIPNTAGCDSVITLNLIINNLTTLDAGVNQTVCEGTDVTLTATGAAAYDWNDDVQNSVPFSAELGSNTYTVEGTDANGCEDEQSVTITGTAYPELTFDVTDPACQGEASGNAVVVASNGTNPYTFVWNNGALEGENNGIAAGTYEVTVTDNIGCETQGEVVVIDPTEPCFNIPGGISPNGDGSNDNWTIGGLSAYPEAMVSVFDRWGQKVYAGDYTSPPWDGTFEGKNLPTADYYYILDLGNGETYNGVATLIR